MARQRSEAKHNLPRYSAITWWSTWATAMAVANQYAMNGIRTRVYRQHRACERFVPKGTPMWAVEVR